MNGFLALIHTDGRPADPTLFENLTRELAHRGCTDFKTWTHGSAAFALAWPPYAIGKTLPDFNGLDLVADLRFDSRNDLISTLGSAPTAADFELLAAAYHRWRHESPLHLLGDFAFAIYDRSRRELFCARDHFGVKPLFYAHTKSGLVVSNSLEPVLAHPDIPHDLNDLAVADYLLFDQQQDPATTVYKHIHRLPAAHSLTFSASGLKLQRYWTLPLDCETRLRSAECPEAFADLLTTAICDSTRDDRRSAVLMSGGLDSTSVAALARELPHEIAAFTLISHATHTDPEEHFSQLAAAHFAIPHTIHSLDNYAPLDGWNTLPHRGPEPASDLFPRAEYDYMLRVMNYSSVALSGYGGDPGLYASATHARRTLKSRNAIPYLAAAARYTLAYRKLPNIGLRTSLRLKPTWDPGPLPSGLSPDLIRDLDLDSRWRTINSPGPLPDALRPEAYRTLTLPTWQQLFWIHDPGFTGLPLEVRHPMFDLRVLTFLLGIPPMPWCVDKELLRVAMKGRLPGPVRLRPKTPAGSAVPVRDGITLAPATPHPELSRYVAKLPQGYQDSNRYETWVNLRLYMLNLWFNGARICP